VNLPAISLWQPYASAVALGLKKIETRHWRAPGRMIGQRVAIHAAKRWDADSMQWIIDCCIIDDLRKKGVANLRDLPFGAIVATAKLDTSAQITKSLRQALSEKSVWGYELLWGNYEDGRYAWFLTEVRALREPIPCTGRQGFFRVDIPDDSEVPK
jgi:hypothetical protein